MANNQYDRIFILYGKGLLYEYTLLLMGEIDSFSAAYFGSRSIDNVGFARCVFRLAFEVFLHWTPEMAEKNLTMDIVRQMKLEKAMRYMDLPDDVGRGGNCSRIVAFVYPDQIHVDEESLVLDTYRLVLAGKDGGGLYRFPKQYFNGLSGRKRASICFRYMMEHCCSFSSIREMYAFFASEQGVRLINKQELKLVLKDVFRSPVLFLHESLPDDLRDEFWYHYYEFQWHYSHEKKLRIQNEKKLRLPTKAV